MPIYTIASPKPHRRNARESKWPLFADLLLLYFQAGVGVAEALGSLGI